MTSGWFPKAAGVVACFLLLGAEAVQCSDAQTLEVTSTADAQDLADALNCTGGGGFSVIWYGSVVVNQIFQVTDGKSLTVTGFGSSPSLSQDVDTSTAAIIGQSIAVGVGMFYVSGASTLTLDNLVLQGAYSEDLLEYGDAGVIKAQGSDGVSQTINVIDCHFTDNYGMLAGAIYARGAVVVNIYGSTSFTGNIGVSFSGAIYALESAVVNTNGTTSFAGNVGSNSGAIVARDAAVVNFHGNAFFTGNTGELSAGAIDVRGNSQLNLYGTSVFFNNTGKWGGALALEDGDFTIGGNATFTSNTAINCGGAIYAASANVNIEGALFTNNAAELDGGAIMARETIITTSGGTTFTNNTASRSGGGLDLTDCETVTISGGVTFSGNVASINGGAMSMDSAISFNIDDATFARNEAGSGGAIWAAPITAFIPNISRCTFEENAATDGGALYLSNSGGIDVHVDSCSFRENTAVASGGAIYHTGTLNVNATRFVANKAFIEGIAVSALGTFSVGSENVSFENNALYCPPGQYGYDEDSTMVEYVDTCRAEAVCTGCSIGCDDVLYGLSFASDSTVPAAVCKTLPVGTVLSPAGTTLATLELAEGYYRTSNESHAVLECYQTDSCVGGLDASNYCAVGYTGPYCAVCAEDYRPTFAYSCHKCSGKSLGSAAVLVVVTAMILVGLVVVILSDLVAVVQLDGSGDKEREGARKFRMWKLSSWRKFLVKIFPTASVKIVVVVWQILTQVGAIAGEVYPDAYQRFLSNLSPINMDIGFILSYSCLARTNFYDRLLLSTTMPLVVFAVLAATYAIAKKKNGTSESAIRTVEHKHLSAALFVMFFVYSSVSFTVFQTFVCDPLDDGVDYLRADYSLSCLSGEHVGYVAYASVMVFVYPIGIPAAFTWWLVRNRHDLTKPDRDTVARLQPFSGLWAAYRPSHFYYEVVECGRRVALTGIAAFVLPGSAAQIAVVLLLAVVFSYISESMRPFKENLEMRLYRWGNAVILGTMYVALLRKVDVSGDDTPAQLAFASVLIAANLFMVAAVLVQSALFVCEQGICGDG